MISSAFRLSAFALFFLVLALWERLSPRRPLSVSQKTRWAINISLTVVNVVAVQVLLGAIAYSAALLAQQNQWGLFNIVELPFLASCILSLLILDFAIYIQHILFHTLPILWRFHMVHHTDLDMDVTTGIRFHPLEIIISLFYKVAFIFLIGASPFTIILFEIILNATSQFNHANVFIPLGIDRWLRWIIVTPDVHRIHHSVSMDETNSNFGFSVTWWDRLCGTFHDQPHAEHTEMPIGLDTYREQKEIGLFSLITLPFKGWMGSYSLKK
jgi:sterol desaturase/sphingolipid hydroxylase (fatty acid hydroxylase superfamily)